MTTAVALQSPTVRRNVGEDMPQDIEETGVEIWNAASRSDTIRLPLAAPRSPNPRRAFLLARRRDLSRG